MGASNSVFKHIYLIRCVLFSVPWLNPLNTAAEVYFATIARRLPFNTAHSMRKMGMKREKKRPRPKICFGKNVECDDKISTMFILSGVFDVSHSVNVFFVLILVRIKLSLMLIAIYVDYWEIVFCVLLFAYFADMLHVLTKELWHTNLFTIERVMNSQLPVRVCARQFLQCD